jgi:hypothetical protein
MTDTSPQRSREPVTAPMGKRLLLIHHEIEAMSLQLEEEELASKLDWSLKSDLDRAANILWSAFAAASMRDEARADK